MQSDVRASRTALCASSNVQLHYLFARRLKTRAASTRRVPPVLCGEYPRPFRRWLLVLCGKSPGQGLNLCRSHRSDCPCASSRLILLFFSKRPSPTSPLPRPRIALPRGPDFGPGTPSRDFGSPPLLGN